MLNVCAVGSDESINVSHLAPLTKVIAHYLLVSSSVGCTESRKRQPKRERARQLSETSFVSVTFNVENLNVLRLLIKAFELEIFLTNLFLFRLFDERNLAMHVVSLKAVSATGDQYH